MGKLKALYSSKWFISIPVYMVFVLYLSMGTKLVYDSYITYINSNLVLNDTSKSAVDTVEDDCVSLTDGSIVSTSDIVEYVQVFKGIGQYYIPEGYLTVEVEPINSIIYLIFNTLIFSVVYFASSRSNLRVKYLYLVKSGLVVGVLSNVLIGFVEVFNKHSSILAEVGEGNRYFQLWMIIVQVWLLSLLIIKKDFKNK